MQSVSSVSPEEATNPMPSGWNRIPRFVMSMLHPTAPFLSTKSDPPKVQIHHVPYPGDADTNHRGAKKISRPGKSPVKPGKLARCARGAHTTGKERRVYMSDH
jgi:hypothetical protein